MTKKEELLVSPVVTKNIFIKLSSNSSMFDNIISIEDPSVFMLANETASLFNEALVPAENKSMRFDVNKAMEVIKKHNNDGGNKLSVTNYTDITKSTSNSKVSVMTNLVLDTIKTVLGIVLAKEPASQLQSAIEGAYVDLNAVADSAWIFWEKKQQKKTTYQYNITFSVEAGPTGLVLLTCPMGLTINVDKEYERVLFITLKDTETYSCRIQALTTAQLAKPTLKSAEAQNVLSALVSDGPKRIE
ncbi:hypothetical protein [Pectobacterium brasiliense]|uniref:hypothetical protein n=1 Tax=Pectobacterium brasiliense TaxID=180957 RepID=UPI003873B1A2